jgi:hypothetical protein
MKNPRQTPLFGYRKLRRSELKNPGDGIRPVRKLELRKLREPSLTPAAIPPPAVRFYERPSNSYVQLPGGSWHRLDAQDESHFGTGYDRSTHEPKIGIYILRKSADRIKIGCDLARVDVNLKPTVLEKLEEQWRSGDAALFSKSALRNVSRKVHFSRSFVTIICVPERLSFWRSELESILSDPFSFDPIPPYRQAPGEQ